MSTAPPETWQSPLLARPSHGLLARHGWLWLAVPGVSILIVGTVISGVLGTPPDNQYGTTRNLTGLGLLVGIALIVIGLPVRAIVVRAHRRSWAPNGPLPSLSGRYASLPVPDAGSSAPPSGGTGTRPHHQTRGAAHLATGVLVLAFTLLIYGTLAAAGAQGLATGIHTFRLQHSSNAVHVTATLDRNTIVQGGRSTTYTDDVSYAIGGTTQHDVAITAGDEERTGDTLSIIVDPNDPRGAVAAADHGYGDLTAGTLCLGFLVAIAIALIVSIRRDRRKHTTRARSTARA